MNKVKTKGWLGQPCIIKSLEQKFGDKAIKERLSLTPGSPRFIARRLENPEDKVSPEEHETYRSGVGTLLYLTKHSRPDICNPVSELSKTMDAPAPVHLKEMYKVIRYVLSTKEHGLKFDLRKDMKKWVTEVDNLQGLYPLRDVWIISCSLKTRLVDQVNTQQQKWIWSKDSMNSTINQRLVEQTQEMDFKLEGSGGSTLDDTLRKQYLSSSDE